MARFRRTDLAPTASVAARLLAETAAGTLRWRPSADGYATTTPEGRTYTVECAIVVMVAGYWLHEAVPGGPAVRIDSPRHDLSRLFSAAARQTEVLEA